MDRNEASLGSYEEANKLTVFLEAAEHERDAARETLASVLDTLNHVHTTEFSTSTCQLCQAQAKIMAAMPPPQALPPRTGRGFRNYSCFTDADGAEVVVRESSAASQHMLRVFTRGGTAGPNDGAMHLTEAQVRRLMRAFEKFLEYA